MHAHPHVRMSSERIHEGRGGGLNLGIHVARVQTSLRFHEHQNEVRLHLALCGQLFAVHEFSARDTVERERVSFLCVGESPVGITFHLLP